MLSPAVDRGPRSESDFLELPVDRAEDLRTSLVEPRRSFSVNFVPESECTEGERLDFPGVSFVLGVRLDVLPLSFRLGGLDGVLGASPTFPPDLPAEKLAGRLAGLLGARLLGCVLGRELSYSEGDREPLVEGDIEPVVEGEELTI